MRSVVISGMIFLLLLLVPLKAPAADDPDELYRSGRYAEAEKAYAQLDMDHPRDLRYRFNRGCAAYHNSDYQGAEAAFSSVLRRAGDRETRSRAAYNLGNTAYRQGDFPSAASFYRRALQEDPASADARHNLELALRAIERQKKEEEKQKPAQGGEKGQEGKDDSGDKRDGEGPLDPSGRGDSSKEGPEEKAPEGAADQPPPGGKEGEERQADKEKNPNPGEGGTASGGRGGELTPGQGSPDGTGEEKGRGAALSMIDRKKAEALLDNIKEDRARFLRFQVPREKMQGAGSGKDW